jgi:UDP-glucose 4-epimerase/UDP-glucuronate decarboxylase
MFTEEARGEVVNVGSNDETQVLTLAEIIIGYMGIDQPIKKFPAPEGSVLRRMPDISKIKRLTGWEPSTILEDGLEVTVRSYMQ